MSTLTWGDPSDRRYEYGVDRGVLYPKAAAGVAWSGLTSVKVEESQTTNETRYLDGAKYMDASRSDEFSAQIEAYSYPSEFDRFTGYDGLVTKQRRQTFGLSYRTLVGPEGALAYKIHLVYNAIAVPSDKEYVSVDTEIELSSFSWDVSTTPVQVAGAQPSAHLVIDASLGWHEATAALEAILYGTELTPPRLPMPDEVMDLFYDNAMLRIIDHGDGTWTAIGPDDVVSMLDETSFQIDRSSAIYLSEDTYTVENY